METWIVTGGAGFIGSHFVRKSREKQFAHIVNIDALTYAGRKENLADLDGDDKYTFVHGDINNKELLDATLKKYQPRYIVHFAAESHVDRSIDDASPFFTTNVMGTLNLIESWRKYWNQLPATYKNSCKFIHISTDEVYGELTKEEPPFTEDSKISPNSPYSSSKASAEHIVSSMSHTYGLPTNILNCSNNYGPYQYPEKLIPLMILKALKGENLPIYGEGLNIRDWIYVEDFVEAIHLVMSDARPNEKYNVGANEEHTNIEIVDLICKSLNALCPREGGESYSEQKTFVKDRLGHDFRYSIDSSKLKKDLGWRPGYDFKTGLSRTISWYLKQYEEGHSIFTG